MDSPDDVTFAVFTMVIGAVLGAVLPPFADALTDLFFKRRDRSSDIYNALILFFTASGLWVIAELLLSLNLIKVGATGASRVLIVLTLGSLFILAAVAFSIGFRRLSKDRCEKTSDHRISRALKFLIFGNMCWISGEIITTLTGIVWPDGYNLARMLHALLLIIAIVGFVAGAISSWRTPSSAPEVANKID